MRRFVLFLSALLWGLAVAQTYVFLTPVERETLDPLGAYDQASQVIVENVYEGLFGYEGEGSVSIEPRLATGYEVSDDGLTYTFHLRDGVLFHSGNTFTCADVEYSLKRALVVNPAGSHGWILAEALLGTGSNASDSLGEEATDEEYAAYWRDIAESVRCVDDRTAVVRLPAPDPGFLPRLTVPAFYIVDSEWAMANGMWDGTEATWRDWVGADLTEHHLHEHASGTGAYRLEMWAAGYRIVAQAHPDYWGGAPQLSTVIYELVDDKDAQVQALLAGEADMVSLVERSDFALLEGQPGVRIYDAATDPSLDWTSIGVWTLYFNQVMNPDDNAYIGSGRLDGLGVPPDLFTDRAARNCFLYAFDQDAFTEEALGGVGELYSMALPPSFLGYDPDIPLQGLDLAKAETHCRAAWDGELWEAGLFMLLPIVEGVSFVEAPARILKANLEALNPRFTVELRSVDWDTYFADIDALNLPLDLAGWLADYPDPHYFMDPYYSSSGFYGGWYGYANERIDALLEEARGADDARRAELYSEIGWIAHEDAPFILIPEPSIFMVMSDRVSGVYSNPMLAGGFLWKDIAKSE